MNTTNQHAELSTWNRERSSEELRSFVAQRFSVLSGVEIE